MLTPLVWSIWVDAQDTGVGPRDYSILPPAPEVASLMDFKDYPVDYFHGIPTINLPIYTLRSWAIEVPITLTYHGGGIRVDQKVGNAGLGWSVLCGATIAHTVYGAPDDANIGNMHGLYHLNTEEKRFRQTLIDKVEDYLPAIWSSTNTHLVSQALDGERYDMGRTDVANDIYNLNGWNMSATFIIDENQKFTIQTDNAITISRATLTQNFSDGGCDGWGFLVTDNTGLKYEFQTQDRTKHEFHHGSPQLNQMTDSLYYASAWHLDKITDPCGNKIIFKYRQRSSIVNKSFGNTICRKTAYHTADYLEIKNINSTASVTYLPQILDHVNANDVCVTFSYYHEGTPNSDALIKGIDISSPDGKHREYRFNYNGRYLKSIVEGDQIIYRFDYKTEYDSYTDHTNQDLGGYHNANHEGSLVPDVFMNDCNVGYGANRSVSVDRAQESVLRKITYPTNGYTEFVWENNVFEYVKSEPYYGEVNDPIKTFMQKDSLVFCYEPGYAKTELIRWTKGINQAATIDLTKYFCMDTGYLSTTAYDDEHFADLNPVYPYVSISEHFSGKEVYRFYLDRKTIEKDHKNKPIPLVLDGTYDFKLMYPDKVQRAEDYLYAEFLYHDRKSGKIYIEKEEIVNYEKGQDLWCGLRIKSIKSVTGTPGDAPLIKHFFYNRDRNPNTSSGTVQMLPKYDYRYFISYPLATVAGYDICEVYNVGGTAFPNVTSGVMSNIEYPHVTVCMGQEDRMDPHSYLNSLCQTYSYTSLRDYETEDYNNTSFLRFQPIGARMYTSRGHCRGNVQRHSITNGAMPVQTTEYVYSIYESESNPVFTTDAFLFVDHSRTPGMNPYLLFDYGIGRYTLSQYNKIVTGIQTTEENGIDSYKTFEYFYDSYTPNTDFGLVKCMTESDPSGIETKTYYTYFRQGSTYLPLPETEVTVSGNTVISATRTVYDPTTHLPLRKYTISGKTNVSDMIIRHGSDHSHADS